MSEWVAGFRRERVVGMETRAHPQRPWACLEAWGLGSLGGSDPFLRICPGGGAAWEGLGWGRRRGGREGPGLCPQH